MAEGLGGPGRDRNDDLFHGMLFTQQPVIAFQDLTNRNIEQKRRVRVWAEPPASRPVRKTRGSAPVPFPRQQGLLRRFHGSRDAP